jgi:hypothetical protein
MIGFYCSWLGEVKGLLLFGDLQLRRSRIEDLCSFWNREWRQMMLVTTIVHNVAYGEAPNQKCIG